MLQVTEDATSEESISSDDDDDAQPKEKSKAKPKAKPEAKLQARPEALAAPTLAAASWFQRIWVEEEMEEATH